MSELNFALKENEPKRLKITWEGRWNNIVFYLDGSIIGKITNVDKLKEGVEFKLYNGSILKAKLNGGGLFSSEELALLYNGKPLPDSSTHPNERLKLSYGIIFFIGGLSIIVGLITQLFKIDFLLKLGFGIESVAYGAIFLMLGFLVKRKSMTALIMAFSLYLFETIFSFVYLIMQSEGSRLGIMVFIKIWFLVMIFKGFSAI
jgi:hypothetical protein